MYYIKYFLKSDKSYTLFTSTFISKEELETFIISIKDDIEIFAMSRCDE